MGFWIEAYNLLLYSPGLDLLPSCCAGDLPEEDVEGLGGGEAPRPVGVGQRDGVSRCHPKLHIH